MRLNYGPVVLKLLDQHSCIYIVWKEFTSKYNLRENFNRLTVRRIFCPELIWSYMHATSLRGTLISMLHFLVPLFAIHTISISVKSD